MGQWVWVRCIACCHVACCLICKDSEQLKILNSDEIKENGIIKVTIYENDAQYVVNVWGLNEGTQMVRIGRPYENILPAFKEIPVTVTYWLPFFLRPFTALLTK